MVTFRRTSFIVICFVSFTFSSFRRHNRYFLSGTAQLCTVGTRGRCHCHDISTLDFLDDGGASQDFPVNGDRAAAQQLKVARGGLHQRYVATGRLLKAQIPVLSLSLNKTGANLFKGQVFKWAKVRCEIYGV